MPAADPASEGTFAKSSLPDRHVGQETVSVPLDESPDADLASAAGDYRGPAASESTDATSTHSQTAVAAGDAGPPPPTDASDAAARSGIPEEQPRSPSQAGCGSDSAHISSGLSKSTIAAHRLASAAAPDSMVCSSGAT